MFSSLNFFALKDSTYLRQTDSWNILKLNFSSSTDCIPALSFNQSILTSESERI